MTKQEKRNKKKEKKVGKELKNYTKIVLFVGRLVVAKGVKLLVEVAKELEGIDFVFIGDGPLSSWAKEQDSRMKNVHYLGRVDNYDLPKYYSAADLLCVPSLCEEGYGRVIIEAISCGTPVIGSNIAGISEVIDEKVGTLFEPCVKDIKRAVLKILSNQERYHKNCLERRKKYSDDNAKAIIDVYLEVLRE